MTISGSRHCGKPGTIILLSLMLVMCLFVTACIEAAESVPGRAMDEVPVQRRLLNDDREYRFANGCVVVLLPDQAVVKTESDDCLLFHRDIALLYASAD